MTEPMQSVYRVCAGQAGRWLVFQEGEVEPVASFDDKAAALNYAMCLARGRVAWHLLLRQGGQSPERATHAVRNPHH